MHQDFDDKVCVVTGGSTGIGLATARLLAERGGRVVVFARHAEDLGRAAADVSPHALAVVGDVSQPDDVRRLFDTVAKEYGGVDALFVNAGVAEFRALEDADDAHYQRLMDVNMRGAFLTMKYAQPLLRVGSSVVFNTSVAAMLGAPLCSLYSATKGAVAAFARGLGAELMERHVRVNCVAPGVVLTEIQAKNPLSEADMARMNPYVGTRLRMGRMGEAREVAEAVAFLLSSRASFVVGQELAVDGGMSGL